jgi:tetratricopeptide (TPR) repeat protein
MDTDSYLDKIEGLWPEPGQSPSKEIVEVCWAAVAEHPESSTLWYDLGIIIQRCDDDYGYTADDYLRCFENSVKCYPDNFEAQQELGYTLDTYFDDFAGATRAFKKAIELGAGAESYYGLARVLAQSGHVDDAIHSISEGVCPFHDDADIQEMRAEILDGLWYHGNPETPKKADTDGRGTGDE